MAEHIYPKKIKGKVYYYLQRTWREKLQIGKESKSKVRTKSIYLGTAISIMERLNKTRKPIEVRHRAFGFVGAIYQTAVEIGLLDLLKEHICGERYGISKWLYFLLPIINRLQYATSKERMGIWAASTVLPDLLDFDPCQLNSRSFWYATEDVISEKALRERRKEHPDLADDLFAGLDDRVFGIIEEKLFGNLHKQLDLSWDVLLYDTTNFFTYLEEPVRSKLARTGHNKDYHHHLKQVGLAMCVDKEWGIPLFHRVYRGNSNDANTFVGIIDKLIMQIRKGFEQVENLVLVFDKGNNSQHNFRSLDGKVKWVGSLVPSHFSDLVDLPLKSYKGRWEKYKYYRCKRQVMGIECALVLTYNEELAHKQEHSLKRGIEKLKQKVQTRWAEYKRKPKHVPAGICTLIKGSPYGKYIRVECKDGHPTFQLTGAVKEKHKYFGKNLLFSSEPGAESGWIITQYHAKQKVENSFKLLKDPGLIHWQPTRHWTDTKIRAFGFCCVISLLLIRVMEFKAAQAGLKMSPSVLKEELSDLQECIMVYDKNTAETQISARSSIQQKLWNLFNLGIVEKQLTIQPVHI